ncbi:MAG: S8 family serine peptidase [Ignavibacteriaceae bacterium]|nr:S8 family serine peptidase [Ignavibacteriaceae bacterium]
MKRLNTIPVILFFVFILTLLLTGFNQAQEKKKITKLDELPRYTYPAEIKASELLVSENEFKLLTEAVRKDILNTLNEYEIDDKTTLKGYYSTLRNIDMLEGNFESALQYTEKILLLQEKPADKLMSGIIDKSLIEAMQKNKTDDKEITRNEFKKNLKTRVDALPWDVVQDDVEQLKGNYEILSENVLVGMIQTQIDPSVEKTKNISGDVAAQLIGMRKFIVLINPYKNEAVEIFSEYIDANKVEKENIWKDRDVDLSEVKNLSKVMVGIWDSGVDIEVFNNQVFINTNEKVDGIDNDNNGFVDDLHGVAFSLEEDYTTRLLYPMTEVELENYPNMKMQIKGLMDLQAAIDSPEATELKKKMSTMNPEDTKPFLEELALFSMFVHGTHVAGIAINNNPYAEVLVARITFDHHAIPAPPTVEVANKAAENYMATVKYFQANKVRVVNMSWGWTLKEIEGMLEANGIGKDAEERSQLTRTIFDIYKDGLYSAIKSAPEILFITAAGNSDNDVTFDEVIPSMFDLPNLITVGAVDQAGEETGFTSFGESVDVHANGFEVDSYLPGGDKIEMSGTSMASPNVVNLAAKLLALDYSLTTTELIKLIVTGADKSEDGRITLINPKKSVELLQAEKK